MALRVNITGNITGFTNVLNEAKTQVRAFNSSVSNEINQSFTGAFKGAVVGMLGFQGLQALAGGFKWLVNTADQIKDVSEQLGMSTDEWQKWSDAVGRAGLSTDRFAEIVETLKEKRTAALTDPKARADLSRMGFSDSDITGNMSTSDFTKQALQLGAYGNQFQREAFDSIVGPRGAAYTRALGYLPSAQAPLSQADIKMMGDAEQALHGLQMAAEKAAAGLINAFASGRAFDFVKDMLQSSSWFSGVVRYLKDPQATKDQKEWEARMNFTPSVAMRDGAQVQAPGAGAPGPGGWWQNWQSQHGQTDANDPMLAVLKQQQHDLDLKDQDRQHQLLESQRDLMTIGDRRRSIRAEMGPLAGEITAHQRALQTPEGFLTDAQRQSLQGVTGVARTIEVNKMRDAFKDELQTLQLRYNKDKADLKQSPLSFQADSMAKVGLYSASALRFNPVMGIQLQQKANQLLEKLVQNTTPSVFMPSVEQRLGSHRP